MSELLCSDSYFGGDIDDKFGGRNTVSLIRGGNR